MSCNRIHLRQLVRQCCFLNLTAGATETRGNERVQDTPTRRHIYGFFTGYNWWLDFNFVKGKRRGLHAHSIRPTCTSIYIYIYIYIYIFTRPWGFIIYIYIYIYIWEYPSHRFWHIYGYKCQNPRLGSCHIFLKMAWVLTIPLIYITWDHILDFNQRYA